MTKMILIVDGDQNQKEQLEYSLHMAGYDVKLAAGRDEALRLLSADEPVTADCPDTATPGQKWSSGQGGFKDLIGVSAAMKQTVLL
ncbi:MAG: hypothetical protein GXP02_07060, partial [Alphaproteobacteria bacterium]|nr:hypothetical protein [Alphaproteobacteria bacterium]